MSAEVDLSEVSRALDDAEAILRKLALNDTRDKVAAEALAACKDAQDHLEDVIFSLADGLLDEGAR